MGPVSASAGPADSGASAPTWTSGAGLSGTAVVGNSTTQIFGNIISGSFKVTGLTAASGDCAATFTLPHALVGGTFTRGDQGGAQIAAANATSGQNLQGFGNPTLSAATMTMSMHNPSLSPLVLDGGLHVSYLYSLL